MEFLFSKLEQYCLKICQWIQFCLIGHRPRKRIPSEGEDKMEPSLDGKTDLVQKFGGTR